MAQNVGTAIQGVCGNTSKPQDNVGEVMTPQEENERYQNWINSWGEYMKPDDGKLFVIRKPSDINDVFDKLENMGV